MDLLISVTGSLAYRKIVPGIFHLLQNMLCQKYYMCLVAFTVQKNIVWLSWNYSLQYEALMALWYEKVPDPWPRVSYLRLLSNSV